MKTVEGIIDDLMRSLSHEGFEINSIGDVDWNSFASTGKEINHNFNVVTTTVTPAMCRLLYAIGWLKVPGSIVSLGSYTGYATSWILCGAYDYLKKNKGDMKEITLKCIDINESSLSISKENFRKIGLETCVDHVLTDAMQFIKDNNSQSDIYFLDIDSPLNGKEDYNKIIIEILDKISHNTLILAHDCSVEKFKYVFREYNSIVNKFSNGKKFIYEVPIDECGLSILQIEV